MSAEKDGCRLVTIDAGNETLDLTSLVQAIFPGPIITRLDDDSDIEVLVTMGIRNAEGKIVDIDEVGGLYAKGESLQCLDPLPGEVITIEATDLNQICGHDDEEGAEGSVEI